ncbi:MAG: hypothetical protein PHT84_05895 [Candidatus Pacebacteria bacterium]|nr:hypothetical protein [Candidatus Paceibacterota bacterium]
MGTRSKNSNITAKNLNEKLNKLDKYIVMHFDQINDTILSGFMRFEAMIEVLLQEGIVDKEKYSNKLKEIFTQMENNIREEFANQASTKIEIPSSEVEIEQEQEIEQGEINKE